MVGHRDDEPGIVAPNVYQFVVKSAEGNDVPMMKYKGFVLLIVNVATRSGFTDLNYTELHQLQQLYKNRQFRVLAFPSNQLGNQEPGTIQQIKNWVNSRELELDVFNKIDVNGPNTPLLWRYLKTCQRGTMGNIIKWNYTKFIVNRNGIPVERFGPAYPPSKLCKHIERYLNGLQ